MYDIPHVLKVMAVPGLGVIVFSILSTLGNIGYFLEMIRLGFRDRAFSYTVGATFLGLSHDLNFVMEYQKWFVEYNDPSMKMWWYFLVFACACELIYLWQLIKFGHKELLPQVSHKVFGLLCLAGLAATAACWISVKQFLNDDIYMFAFGVTVFWQAPFGTALLLRRRTTLGASQFQWVSFIVMTVGYWSLTSFYFGGAFAQLSWRLLGIATLAWGAFNLWLVSMLPAAKPANESNLL